MADPTFILGGHQTDFAHNWARAGDGFPELCAAAVQGALADAQVDASEIEVGHVGNFAGGLYAGQGHLGAFLVESDPALYGLPASRHEAACASGSIAILSAMADLEAGRYDVALVLGVELMRTMNGFESQKVLGSAAWVPRETEGVDWPWPQLFSDLGDEYDRRYGIDHEHLMALARSNFDNATRNPNAQTRDWSFSDESFDPTDDEANPVVSGRIRRQDCSQVTDGAVAVVLASPRFLERGWLGRSGRAEQDVARITGWGHHTSRMALADKLDDARDEPYVCPHVRQTVTDALDRAKITVDDLDCVETHDCFTTTHYMAIDHFGVTEPGESWKAIEDGTVAFDGALPFNASGGLMGAGHPVGATGIRMAFDQAKQVTGTAGDYQVPGAKRAATLNIGGSATTSVSLVVEAGV